MYARCRISALALAKMCRHAAAGGSNEVMGMLLGSARPAAHKGTSFDGDRRGDSHGDPHGDHHGDRHGEFVIDDVFALPVEASETRVNAMGEAYEYIVRYLSAHRREHATQIVGWYHSHPGYGCFLSGIDVDTQAQNQAFQDPFVAIVVDPVKTAAAGRAEIGAFRTSNGTFYALDVQYFQHPRDAALLTLLDNKTWARTLAQ